MGDIQKSAHSKWRCGYHTIFAPKYRRKEIYGKLKADIGQILRKLCTEQILEILEAKAFTDHIHMLASFPPYLNKAQFMGCPNGKSSLTLFERQANRKYKYGSRNFWVRRYFVDTVGRNKRVIKEYIKNQLKEYMTPFTGNKNK